MIHYHGRMDLHFIVGTLLAFGYEQLYPNVFVKLLPRAVAPSCPGGVRVVVRLDSSRGVHSATHHPLSAAEEQWGVATTPPAYFSCAYTLLQALSRELVLRGQFGCKPFLQ